MTKINLNKLTSLLKCHYPEIEIAYIFGSARNGNLRKGGDIDIALYLKLNYDILLEFSIANHLQEQFHQPVDLIILNKCNPILAHQVLANGQRLFERNSTLRAQLELKIFKNFLDNKYYLEKSYHG